MYAKSKSNLVTQVQFSQQLWWIMERRNHRRVPLWPWYNFPHHESGIVSRFQVAHDTKHQAVILQSSSSACLPIYTDLPSHSCAQQNTSELNSRQLIVLQMCQFFWAFFLRQLCFYFDSSSKKQLCSTWYRNHSNVYTDFLFSIL